MPYSDSRIIQNLSPFPENGNDQWSRSGNFISLIVNIILWICQKQFNEPMIIAATDE